MVGKRYFSFLGLSIVICFYQPLHALADISLMVIDLKYNERDGIKICEIQPGSYSRFSGSDKLEELNAVPNKYISILKAYGFKGYFNHPIYSDMKRSLIKHGWTSAHSAMQIASSHQENPFFDPDDLYSFPSAFLSLQPEAVLQGDPLKFKQILFLDRAILPFSKNKYQMNMLLDKIDSAKKLRPIWGIYKKGIGDDLVNRIIQTIPGDVIVIKPVASTMGRGVIFIEKKDLKKTLNYIFATPKETLIHDNNRSYSHYALDRTPYFIVEEFIPSDPLFLAEPPLAYDCTMRVVVLLTYHLKKPTLTFLSQYFYSPSKPLDPSYTLIEQYKAKGTHVCEVSPKVWNCVKTQLTPVLLEVYQTMLDAYDAYFSSQVTLPE